MMRRQARLSAAIAQGPPSFIFNYEDPLFICFTPFCMVSCMSIWRSGNYGSGSGTGGDGDPFGAAFHCARVRLFLYRLPIERPMRQVPCGQGAHDETGLSAVRDDRPAGPERGAPSEYRVP